MKKAPDTSQGIVATCSSYDEIFHDDAISSLPAYPAVVRLSSCKKSHCQRKMVMNSCRGRILNIDQYVVKLLTSITVHFSNKMVNFWDFEPPYTTIVF